MAFTDFPNGLTSAADYLSANNSITSQLTGSVADINRLVVSAAIDSNLKEIICSLMAGRGLKLPNLQICISLNLKELLGSFVGQIQDVLYQALSRLDTAFDELMSHLKLDAVLGRINGLLGEITSIANMINFCSAPINPIQIPNVLQTAMDSFLGKGKALIDQIGTILPDQIGGCLINGIASFNGGILGKLNDNYAELIAGTLDDAFISGVIQDIDSVAGQITDLIASETNVPTNYDMGGSDLAESPRPTNTGIGVLYNATDEGISGATRNGSGLWSAYQQLGSYQVVDDAGNVYNNIFELFCDEDLLRILRRSPNPTPEISEQIPVYNYCGEIIGYTLQVSQDDPDVSIGTVPGVIDQPGFNAGGLPTNPLTTAGTGGEGSTIVIGGEEITASNVGTGSGVFKQRVLDNLEFRSLKAGVGITIGQNSDDIEIAATDTTLKGTVNTTTATATEVLFSGVRQTPPTNTCWFVTLTAVANRSTTNDATAIKIEGIVDNNGGTVTIVGAPGNKTTYGGTSGTSNYNLLIDIVANEFRVRVQGDAAHTVDWVVKFDFIASP